MFPLRFNFFFCNITKSFFLRISYTSMNLDNFHLSSLTNSSHGHPLKFLVSFLKIIIATHTYTGKHACTHMHTLLRLHGCRFPVLCSRHYLVADILCLCLSQSCPSSGMFYEVWVSCCKCISWGWLHYSCSLHFN